MGGTWPRPCIIWNSRTSLQSVRRCTNVSHWRSSNIPLINAEHWCCGGGLVSIVLSDVGPSLVGGWILPHEGTMLQKHIRHAGERGCCIVSP